MRQVVFLCAVFLLLGPSRGVAAERERLLVMEPRLERGIDPSIAPVLDPVILDAFGRTGRFHVVARSEIELTLSRAGEAQLAGCDSALTDACLTEIGGALGARFVAAVTVGVLGEKYIVSIKVVDMLAAQTRRWSAETVATEAVLTATVRRGVHELLPPEGPRPVVLGLGAGAILAGLATGVLGLLVLSNAGTMRQTTDPVAYKGLEDATRGLAVGVNVGAVLSLAAFAAAGTFAILPER